MAKKLLLLSKTPEDLIFASQIAIISGLEIHPLMNHRDCVDLIQKLSEKEIGALFIDCTEEKNFTQFETYLQEEIGLFSEKVNTNHFHFITASDIDSVPFLSKSPLFGNFIVRKYKTADEALAAGKRYAYYTKATVGPRAFGMKNYFSADAQVQSIQMKRSIQKLQVVEAIRGYLIKAKFPSRIANTIANAVDEIVMNSVFTSPVDDLGNRPLDSTPRDTDFELTDKSQVEVTVAFDEGLVGISSTDLFGSLDKSKLVQHLSNVYHDEDYKVRANTASAGIGLNNTFKGGGSLIFNCEKGIKTEVGVIFERTDNYREFKKQFRFLCTQFYYPSEDVGL